MVLLTGATGYIGLRVLERLAASGRRVRCLVMPGDATPLPTSAGIEVARGEVTDYDSIASSAAGVDTIVHCAAAMLPNPPDLITTVNVNGTANMLRLAREHRIPRFIYLSAVSAVYEHKNVYGRSKAAAERSIEESGVQYTILRPTMVYGRGGGLHFQKLVGLIRRAPGILPVFGPGRAQLQPVSVTDVVSAVELALTQPAAVNKTYGVSGATVLTFNELIDRLAGRLGVRRLKVHVPLGVCEVIARAVTRVAGPSFFSPDALAGINENATLDYRPFQAECGYGPLALDAGLAQVFGPDGHDGR